MLYILECMALVVLCMHGGYYDAMYTTGEPISWKEVGVCALSWLVVVLFIDFIVYSKRYFVRRKKESETKDDKTTICKTDIKVEEHIKYSGFWSGPLYILECMALGILCLMGGIDRKMSTTGKKFSGKEIALCVISWLLFFMAVASITLICVFS